MATRKSVKDIIRQMARLMVNARASGNFARAERIEAIGDRYRDNIYKSKSYKRGFESAYRNYEGRDKFEERVDKLDARKYSRKTYMGKNQG